MEQVKEEIHAAPNRVRYTMNGFIIAAGTFVPALTAEAIQLARKIGVITCGYEWNCLQSPLRT